MPAHIPARERFLDYVPNTISSECWDWLGTINKDGYGVISERTRGKFRQHKAHRLSYEHFVGPIPEGLGIDHQCQNRSCVNPKHLKPATVKENGENRKPNQGSTSGYLGVYFASRRGAWKVVVQHSGRQHFGGYFNDEHEAGEAARLLRVKLFSNNPQDRLDDLHARQALRGRSRP